MHLNYPTISYAKYSAKVITTICFFACADLTGCASQHGKFYDGETLPPDKVVVVTLPIPKIERTSKLILPIAMDVEIDKHKLFNNKENNIGYFKPGDYEFKLVSRWWDNENKSKNAARTIALPTCATFTVAPYLLPLAITCAPFIPDKTCKSTWIINLEAGKKYSIDVDWTVDPPQTIVKDENNQQEVVSTTCEIRKPEQSK